MSARILLKNFIIVDGQRDSESFQGDILIEGDRIIKVGQLQADQPSTRIIQGDNSYIFPGFIDIHSHGDLMNFAPEGLSKKVKQGITTEVAGQCGLGTAPIKEGVKSGWHQHMIIRNPLPKIPWNSVAEYFSQLQQRGLDNNLAYFLPHGLLRYNIRKGSKEPMNAEEFEEFRDLAIKSFEEGAIGLSLGLCYFPAVYADSRELKTLFKLADKYNKIISVHLRSEATGILDSLDEIINLAEGTNCRINISHLKVIGRSNEAKLDKLLEKIANNSFTFDSYPYTFGNTSLEIIIPPEFIDEQGLDALKDNQVREELKEIYQTGAYENISWDNLPYLLGWDNIYITGLNSGDRGDISGLSIKAIGDRLGKEPADAAFDLLLEEDGSILMQDYFMEESVVKKILSNQNGSIGTDSLFSKTNQHPRTSSAYPRILKKYVFENQTITLAEAINKFSQKSAEKLGLKDRGEIAPGMKADLVIFSKDELLNGRGNGIQSVLINGKFKQEEGIYHPDRKPGEIINK